MNRRHFDSQRDFSPPRSSKERRFFSLEMENKAQQPAQGKQLIKKIHITHFFFSKKSFLLNFLGASSSTPTPQTSTSSSGQNSPGKYSELLAVIEELGKDIRPTYAGSKNAAERLKKGKQKISFCIDTISSSAPVFQIRLLLHFYQHDY